MKIFNENPAETMTQIDKIKEISLTPNNFISALISLINLEDNEEKKEIIKETLLEESKTLPNSNLEEILFKKNALRIAGLSSVDAMDYIGTHKYFLNIAKKAKDHLKCINLNHKEYIENAFNELIKKGKLPNSHEVGSNDTYNAILPNNYKIIWKNLGGNEIKILDIRKPEGFNSKFRI